MPCKRKTDKEFREEFNTILGSDYTLLSPYIRSNLKVKVKHNVCGRVYEILPTNILRGSKCNSCQAKKAIAPYKISNDEFETRVHKKLGSDYKILSKYKNVRTKVKVRHVPCGYEYNILPANLYAGHKCPRCTIKSTSKKLSKSSQEYENEFYSEVGKEYTLLTPYKTKRSKVLVRHNTCGTVYEVYPDSFVRDSARCNRCNSLVKSKGELNVSYLLDQYKIAYLEQKGFVWLVNKRSLKYDFYLPKCKIALEVDGLQHYKPISFFGGEEQFLNIQERDKQKDHLSNLHGISVIRLPYYDQKNLSELRQTVVDLINKRIIY